MLRLGLVGVDGRMGQAILHAAAGADEVVIAGGLRRAGDPTGGFADAAALAGAVDVLVDFSAPAALPESLAAAQAGGCALLVGTTGLQPADHQLIDRAAAALPVLQAANTSLGVALLATLVERAAAALGPDWDIEVLEAHHRHKRDAPSGTALLLGAAAARGRGGADAVVDRAAQPGVRVPGTIGYASLRGGSIAGDHQVLFAGEGERLELGHRAEGRETFARGAIHAARWLRGRSPGRYHMRDVLDLP